MKNIIYDTLLLSKKIHFDFEAIIVCFIDCELPRFTTTTTK